MKPVKLPNGVSVFNATPHPLYFLCGGEEVVTVESHAVVNAIPSTKTVKETEQYTLNEVTFLNSVEGKEILRRFRQEDEDALVVGSIIAAQAFPGEIVAPVPVQSGRTAKLSRTERLVRSDRFTIFTKENERGS